MEGDEPLNLYLRKLAGNIPLRLTWVVLLTAVAIWGFSATETPVYSLFQSSVQTSAVATPTPVPPPTNTPVPAAPAAATDTPVPPIAPTTPDKQPTQPPAAPTNTPVIQGGAVPTQAESTPTIAPSQTEPAVLHPIEPTAPAASPAAVTPQALPTAAGGMVVNQVKLVDTMVKWLAYGWLCLGGLALILVAGFFAYLHNRGKKLNRETEE